MNNKSSKDYMDKQLEILSTIKKVKAPSDMFDVITSQLVKPKMISLTFIRAVASIFILVVGCEVYMCVDYLKQKESRSEMMVDYAVTDNFLYHE